MNVYDFADKLLEKLSGMRITMENLAVNEQSYDYISNLLTANELFPNYERLNLLKIAKSDEMATKHRLRGNELFRDRKYFQALCAYNESLCFARPDSEAIGLGFANRSAVFLEIGEFGRCRKNIELAKRFKYPEKNFYKLDKREQSCPETNNLKPEECDSLHLTLKPNRKYPFIADCLKMKRNVNFGRHIVTNSELKTGEVIAIEPSFSALLLPSCLAKRCTNCLGQFQLDLLPCPRCTSAMFCSENCMGEANKKFHKFECDYPNGFETFLTIAVRASLRTFYEALNIFDDSLDSLRDFVIRSKNSEATIFDVDINNVTYKKQIFSAVDTLSTNKESRSTVDKFRRAIVCSILSDFFQKNSRLSDTLNCVEKNKFFMSFVYKHTQVAESNFHELYALSPQTSHQENEQFGVGSFPFCSLLNHSCSPNVFRLTFDGLNYIVASRRIMKGEQIFDNYGFHHALHPLRDRKLGLSERYQFICKCDACVHNFPLFEELSEADEGFDSFIDNDLNVLEEFSCDEAKRAIKKYSEYVDRFSKRLPFPCYEISLLQECILRCFRVFEQQRSNINSKLIEK